MEILIFFAIETFWNLLILQIVQNIKKSLYSNYSYFAIMDANDREHCPFFAVACKQWSAGKIGSHGLDLWMIYRSWNTSIILNYFFGLLLVTVLYKVPRSKFSAEMVRVVRSRSSLNTPGPSKQLTASSASYKSSEESPASKKRGRCSFCENSDNKHKHNTTCSICKKFTCKQHRKNNCPECQLWERWHFFDW